MSSARSRAGVASRCAAGRSRRPRSGPWPTGPCMLPPPPRRGVPPPLNSVLHRGSRRRPADCVCRVRWRRGGAGGSCGHGGPRQAARRGCGSDPVAPGPVRDGRPGPRTCGGDLRGRHRGGPGRRVQRPAGERGPHRAGSPARAAGCVRPVRVPDHPVHGGPSALGPVRVRHRPRQRHRDRVRLAARSRTIRAGGVPDLRLRRRRARPRRSVRSGRRRNPRPDADPPSDRSRHRGPRRRPGRRRVRRPSAAPCAQQARPDQRSSVVIAVSGAVRDEADRAATGVLPAARRGGGGGMRTGAPVGQVGNFHEAGFYSSDAEFLALILPFVIDGLAAGEPVVIGYDPRKCDLLRAALPRPEAVTFIVDTSLYASPAGAIEAYRQQVERHVSGGAGQIRIARDVPHEGNGGRFDGWDRYESAVNVVWQDYPVWSRCLYDATTVPDDVRDVVQRTHRRLVTPDGGAGASPAYQDVPEFEGLPPTVDPLEGNAPVVGLIDASLKGTRRRVAEAAHGRIAPAELDDLLFALSEAVVNAQLYGRPPVTVRVWTGADRIVVHVHDTGPGPANRLTGLVPAPEGSSGAGLGLWLSHQLPHIDVALVTDTGGFTVRLRAGPLPRAEDSTFAPVPFHAGTPDGAPASRGTVHAIDGDGSSFCDLIDAAELVQLDGVLWSDIPPVQRCSGCELLTAALGHGRANSKPTPARPRAGTWHS